MRRIALAAAVVGAAQLAGAGPAVALAQTNLEFVTDAVARAVGDAVSGLDLAGQGQDAGPVLIQAQAGHSANWLFEHILVEELLRRGLAVTLDSAAVDGASPRLSYRVADLEVSGSSGLLHGSVSRRCRVLVSLGYSRNAETVWTGEGRAEAADRVSARELDALQDSRYDFARTELEKRTWGRYVEPVIVTAVLGSLVYLFFSNR